MLIRKKKDLFPVHMKDRNYPCLSNTHPSSHSPGHLLTHRLAQLKHVHISSAKDSSFIAYLAQHTKSAFTKV